MSWFSRNRQGSRLPALSITPDHCVTEENLAARVAEQVAAYLDHQGVFVYWLDQDRKALHLRATLTATKTVALAADYSGLVADTGVTPVPLAVEPPSGRPLPRPWGAADEPWLDVPVGRYLLVRYRLPRRQPASRVQVDQFVEWSDDQANLVALAHALLSARHEGERLRSMVQSGQTALDTLFRPESAADLLLGLATTLFGAEDAAIVVATTALPRWRCLASRGRGVDWWQDLRKQTGLVWPQPLTQQQWQTPDGGARTLVAVPAVVNETAVGGLYLFLNGVPEWDDYRRAVLLTLGDRVGQLMAQQELSQQATQGYLETLRALVTAMDSLSPQSLGHSDRLARYSRLMAQELGMAPAEVEAVALGAFLHDVGMVTIPPEVVLKPGRLTAAEYEQMKNHTLVGSQLVAAVQAALPVAPMIAAHHERWDGMGYPRGLRGEEIPLGARVIAVADAFEAKTTGRAYRKPLPFDQALADLQAAGGSQLDPEVVAAFVGALSKLRETASPRVPPSPCWEIKQLSIEVCAGCPSRLPRPVACWENPGRLCQRHGDTCATCLVFTEALGRAGEKHSRMLP